MVFETCVNNLFYIGFIACEALFNQIWVSIWVKSLLEGMLFWDFESHFWKYSRASSWDWGVVSTIYYLKFVYSVWFWSFNWWISSWKAETRYLKFLWFIYIRKILLCQVGCYQSLYPPGVSLRKIGYCFGRLAFRRRTLPHNLHYHSFW